MSLFDVLHNGQDLTSAYVCALIERVRACNALPQHASLDWRLITTRVEEYTSSAERCGLLAVFYLILARESSLQEFVASTLAPGSAELHFFRTAWLPYLLRLTELLRTYYYPHPNAEFERYSDSLREAWLLQCVLPNPIHADELAGIKPITLLRSTEQPVLPCDTLTLPQ